MSDRIRQDLTDREVDVLNDSYRCKACGHLEVLHFHSPYGDGKERCHACPDERCET